MNWAIIISRVDYQVRLTDLAICFIIGHNRLLLIIIEHTYCFATRLAGKRDRVVFHTSNFRIKLQRQRTLRGLF